MKNQNLPPLGATVTVIKGITEKEKRIGQTGTVIDYSMHGMVCVHFADLPPGTGIYYNSSHLK